MNKIDVYGLSGEVVGTTTLPSCLFDAPIRRALIEQAVFVYRENQRQYTAHAKGRSDVRGGGKKPWKQKGTGRARQGSTRSAQWRGGGIIFGPQAGERRRLSITKKMRARMLTSIFTWFAGEGRIVVLDTMELTAPGTKQLASALTAAVGASTAMFIDASPNENFVKSLRNISGWEYQHIDALNVMNLLLPRRLVLSKAAIDILAKRYPEVQQKKAFDGTQIVAAEKVSGVAKRVAKEALDKTKPDIMEAAVSKKPAIKTKSKTVKKETTKIDSEDMRPAVRKTASKKPTSDI